MSLRQGKELSLNMDPDGFLYGTGFLSDDGSDGQSEVSQISSVDGVSAAQFCCELTS